MKIASIKHGSGPGSSISLDPETIKVRNSIIKNFIDKPIDELNQFIDIELQSETNENKRLGILAARIYIIRMNISKVTEFNDDTSLNLVVKPSPREIADHISKNSTSPETNKMSDTSKLDEWTELKMIEAGEVNGVRFPKGITITVGADDASRLINSGKAILTEEKPTENEKNQKKDSDSDKTPKEPQSLDEKEQFEKLEELKDNTPDENSSTKEKMSSEDSSDKEQQELLEPEDIGSKKEEPKK